MTAAALVILAMTLAPHVQSTGQQPFDAAQGAPSEVERQQTPPPPPTVAAPAQASPQAADPAKTITLTGCVVPAVDTEDTLQLVPAEPDPARPIGTAGPSPAWTVPAYLLLGGTISFAEHANKTVEITGILEPAAEAPDDPKKTGDTTMRTGQAAPAPARLQVQSAKVIAATCRPKQIKQVKQVKQVNE